MPLEPVHWVQLLILQQSDTGRSATKEQRLNSHLSIGKVGINTAYVIGPAMSIKYTVLKYRCTLHMNIQGYFLCRGHRGILFMRTGVRKSDRGQDGYFKIRYHRQEFSSSP